MADYHNHLLIEGKTTILHHQAHYTDMQIKLEATINEINHYIDTTNHSINMPTPMCQLDTAGAKRGAENTWKTSTKNWKMGSMGQKKQENYGQLQ